MTSVSSVPDSGIPQPVRRALRRTILELRGVLEEDFRKQLTALGVRENGVQPPPAGRALSAADQRARDAAIAVIEREVKGDASYRHALELFIRESAYTFLNRVFGLRCLEERGLLLVDGQTEQAIRLDPARGASSLYWRVRNTLPPSTNPREVWRETLCRAWIALSERVKLLFDPDSELAALLPLPPTLKKVMDALNSPEIPPESYAQDEILGWVYQYYNSQAKDEVYARLRKGAKLEQPEEISVATCLYTERYMVDYLLQNTLGALWVRMHPESDLPARWPYFVSREDGSPWRADLPVSRTVAAENGLEDEPPGEPNRGGRPGAARQEPRPPGAPPSQDDGGASPFLPRRAREITLMDPACGGGHFLVRAFDMLAEIYREEGLEAEAEIPQLILERNLHGIDIDGRAVQIAALALYIKGCALAGPDFRPRRLNLIAADALLAGDEPPAGYMRRFQGETEVEELVRGIWRGLRDVRTYGSLLHPERAVDEAVKRRRAREKGQFWEADDAHWEQWKGDLLRGIREQFEAESDSEDLGQRLFGREVARGVGLVEALGRRYDVVVANPPYQGSGSLDPAYKAFLAREYAEGKRDLYAAFILRCMDFCHRHGRLGMVTQQSWMFLRSFAGLRKRALEETALGTIAHLGPRAFDEISGEVVNIALFTLEAAPPAPEHRLTGFRLIGPKSASEKARLLGEAIAGRAPSVVSTPKQSDFVAIPETPFVYWLRPRFFELLQSLPRLRDVAEVRQGLATADNERFTRCFWEVSEFGVVREGKPVSGQWFWYAKGGRYQKWAGLEWLVVDWENNGERIKGLVGSNGRIASRPQSESYYFRPGLTYSPMGRGSMGTRRLRDSIFDVKGASVFPSDGHTVQGLAALLSTRLHSYLLRAATQYSELHVGYVSNLPRPESPIAQLVPLGGSCMALKALIVGNDVVEKLFRGALLEEGVDYKAAIDSLDSGSYLLDSSRRTSLKSRSDLGELRTLAADAYLLHMEAEAEAEVNRLYSLSDDDVLSMVDETGTTAGWYPLIAGYEETPESPDSITLPESLNEYLAQHQRVRLSPEELSRLNTRLRALYHAGPGAKAEEPEDEAGGDEEAEVLGGRIPIPAETFLEELSQKLEVHPISLYWLLKEMRDREGLVCPPELKRHLEDYASVSLLRILGYRWPEQDRHEAAHGPILDPALVDEDGIVPLVPCGGEPTAEERIRARLERDFGEEGAERSLGEFRRWAGRDLGDWLRREFFKRHVQQFKQRPIAWHLTSPNGTFQAFVLYHKLSRETLQRLRAQYAGSLIERLRGDQERAKARGAAAEVTALQLHIEDVEEFRSRLEHIERGDELRYRVRCRWKGEEEAGRPGPYAPDIDDGVKVNIRPFQEAGLLAVKQVIKKW